MEHAPQETETQDANASVSAPSKTLAQPGWQKIIGVSAGLSAIVSAVIACIAIFVQNNISETDRSAQGRGYNLTLLQQTHEQLLENPQLWQIHGVDLEELKQKGVDSDELTYIFMNLISAYASETTQKTDYTPSNYRMQFLKSAKVQIAWKHAIRQMVDDTVFRNGIDDFIASNPANPKSAGR